MGFHMEVPPSNTPGFGCNSPGGSDPCCMVEGKLCCLWSNLETDTCCDDGWIELTSKVCCCVIDASYPAGRTPGFACCNKSFCGANGMNIGKGSDDPAVE